MGDPIPAPFAGHGSATTTITDKANIDGGWSMTSYLLADPALLKASWSLRESVALLRANA
jgi:hypothetical protein